MAVDLPDGEAIQLTLPDLKNMVPASAFQIRGILLDTDQLQTTEGKGGESVFDDGFEQKLRVPDTAQFKGAANHCAIVLHK